MIGNSLLLLLLSAIPLLLMKAHKHTINHRLLRPRLVVLMERMIGERSEEDIYTEGHDERFLEVS